MNPSANNCFRFISLLFLLLALSGSLKAQSLFPGNDGERTRLSCQIEMSRGYISGICLLYHDGDEVKGSIVNEFGISAADFTYYPERQKIRLHSVIKMLDKWYLRRIFRRDLRQVMLGLQAGKTTYENTRHHITYTFTPAAVSTQDGRCP